MLSVPVPVPVPVPSKGELKAKADDTYRDLDYSGYHIKPNRHRS